MTLQPTPSPDMYDDDSDDEDNQTAAAGQMSHNQKQVGPYFLSLPCCSASVSFSAHLIYINCLFI